MKFVAPVRKELGIRTIFNILGPLANPAGANYELMGVYDETFVEPLAQVLMRLGVKRAIVVHGQDGLDEITLSAPTTCCEVRDGKTTSFVITPEELGLTRCAKEALVGGNPQENAAITRAILDGQKGARRDAVVLNAAASIYMVRDGVTLKDAVGIAEELIDSGKAKAQLEKFVEMSNR